MKKILSLLSFIIFINVVNAQNITKFENWTNYNVFLTPLTAPTNWYGTDSLVVAYGKLTNPLGTYVKQIFKQTPGNGGSGSALRVATKFQDSLVIIPAKNLPGACTNSRISIDLLNSGFTQEGGSPINFNAVSTSMYVKNTIVGNDSTYITALLIDDSDGGDSIIAIADTALGANITAFTKLVLPFKYLGSTLTPTIVRYTIASGSMAAVFDTSSTFTANVGTEIIVDDIDIQAATGVENIIFSSSRAMVYPSYFQSDVNVDFGDNRVKNAEFVLYSHGGKVILKSALNSKNTKISIPAIANGLYHYTISSENNLIQSGKLMKQE